MAIVCISTQIRHLYYYLSKLTTDILSIFHSSIRPYKEAEVKGYIIFLEQAGKGASRNIQINFQLDTSVQRINFSCYKYAINAFLSSKWKS